MTATYVINPLFWNSIQITFDCIPDKEIREKMTKLKFKWHKKSRYWYATQTDERLKLAKEICGIEQTEPEKAEPKPKKKTAKSEKANKFGVQIGDIFSCTWGYDQTNVDFFQVVKLCGEKSVRVRAVQPKVVSEEASGGMSAYRTYEITREILPAVSSVFINDTENGDLKKLKSWKDDGVSDPIFSIGSGGHNCHLEPIGNNRHYESWCH